MDPPDPGAVRHGRRGARILSGEAVMRTLVARVDAALGAAIVALMGLMVLTVTWQVITRYVLDSPSSYTEELATYLLIWVSLLGAAYAVRQRAHLGIDVLVARLPAARRRVIEQLAYAAVIACAVIIFIFGGSRLMYVTLHLKQVSAAFRVPVGYVYSVVPISGVLMLFYGVAGILDLRAGRGATPTSGQVLHAPD
jgi:TRAP-type C4-dicarboxylate transport system permease small subunit